MAKQSTKITWKPQSDLMPQWGIPVLVGSLTFLIFGMIAMIVIMATLIGK